MSDHERPEAAFRELEEAIRLLADEMSTWRRRAQRAEARLRELEATLSHSKGANGAHADRATAELSARLETARDRTRQLLDRMRFLRQQHESEAES